MVDRWYREAVIYGVHPRLGSLGDFAELTLQAAQRGIRIVLDLVVNHTSDQHPWFRSARADPRSPYRDWYVWTDSVPADRRQGIVFPGGQTETWTFDEAAQAWYFHRFYAFQPDLNWANPAVRDEIGQVVGFWQQLGVSGFRVDAAPFVLEQVAPDVDPAPQDLTILDRWRQDLQWRGETHENCPRNAVRASRRNARVAASVVGHGEWVVDDVSGRGHYEVRQGVQGRRQADEGSHPGRGDVGDRLVAGQRPASAVRRRAAPARGRPAGRQRSRRFVVRRLRPASAVAAMPASTGDLMLVRVACSRRASDCSVPAVGSQPRISSASSGPAKIRSTA